MTNANNGSRLPPDATSPSAVTTCGPGSTTPETPTPSRPSNDKQASRSTRRKRHPRTQAQDRALIAAAIELIQGKLDNLPQPDRIKIAAEVTRRLALRLHTEGEKLADAMDPENPRR